ncbi:hypothetical protein [Streptomyces sp. NPDC048442]|uniref:hypothetical protein n=1 Tax=Streptomyces sp. NPDC048442 TaxID=3154823 RepID=UPI0034304600
MTRTGFRRSLARAASRIFKWPFKWPRGALYRKLIAIAVILALAGLGYWIWWAFLRQDLTCAAGVAKQEVGGECVGVTDGSYVFTPSLKQVFDRIKAENDSVAGKNPAGVALMIPMISDNAAEQKEFTEQVQGAYLAQHRANHQDNHKRPPIRLLLANPGRGYRYAKFAADKLGASAASDKENLRAVAGINISIDASKDAVRYLTNEKKIPVVAGPMTADDIANSASGPNQFPGLARVAPGNTDQANALAAFGAKIKPGETQLVADSREGDNYLTSLRETFQRLAKDAPHEPETYKSPDDFNDEGNLSNDFNAMVSGICSSDAKTLYFAGRPVQLRQFLIELGNRNCSKKHYTVISGSHASTLTVDEKFADQWGALTKGAGITVRYAALAHPDAWGDKSNLATGGSKAAAKELSDLLARATGGTPNSIGDATLADGRVIITYDAVTTAITGIRNSTRGTVKMPTLSEVSNSWLRLHGTNRVNGASGWICLDQYGNPDNKAVPIVHLDPATRTAVFDRIAWPAGQAPDANCSIRKKG